MDRIHRFIRNGPPDDSPVDWFLRDTFWGLVNSLRLSYDAWRKLMDEYTSNPKYAIKSQVAPPERASRLTNVLTGGSSKGLTTDMTWKRFIEALVAIKTEELWVTCEATRGKFGTKKQAHIVCRPSDELIKALNQIPVNYTESTTSALARYFQNTEHTATSVMDHPLSKLLWVLFTQFKIDEAMWRKLSMKYVSDPRNCVASEKRRGDKRHNLQSAIRSTDRLTWKRFLESLKAIDCKSLTVTFTIKTTNMPVVDHTVEIDLTKLTFWSNGNEPE